MRIGRFGYELCAKAGSAANAASIRSTRSMIRLLLHLGAGVLHRDRKLLDFRIPERAEILRPEKMQRQSRLLIGGGGLRVLQRAPDLGLQDRDHRGGRTG